ncbi:hypothetical protein, partial [Paenibacillus sp. KS1]|uniref:hypothetical protein n=1 Tax=Paenibacillus sp. KS1 TaxID=1849249 RepID=UPI001C2F12C0
SSQNVGCGGGGKKEGPYEGTERGRVDLLREKYSHLSPNERSARLQQLAEENAHRILQDLENSIARAHFVERHGAQTTLQSQYDRAAQGINPTTGVVDTDRRGIPRIPTAATKFLSHRDQVNMIQRAQQILDNAGDPLKAQEPIIFDHIIGSGYQRGTLDYGTSRSGQVFFNRNNQPITSFPIWER